MRKLILLAMAFIILLPAAGLCAKNKDEEDKKSKKKDEKVVKPAVYYHILFKTGGVYEASNYTIEKKHIMVILESGPIFLDKAMVTAIEKYEGDAEEPSMRINVTPDTVGRSEERGPAQTGGPSGLAGTGIEIRKAEPEVEAKEPKGGPLMEPGTGEPEPEEVMDDEGHNERWWKIKMSKWVRQHEEAINVYDEAKREWNKYDGALANLKATGSATDYDIQRYQDLRGASRIKMDRAKAEIKEAEHKLTVVIPEEARKAGAPKWWVNWDEEEWTE